LPVDVVQRADSEPGDLGLVKVIPQRYGCLDAVPDAARSPLDDRPPAVFGVEGDVGEGIDGVGDEPGCADGAGVLWGICVVTELQAGHMELT
jgi:hypothetical protein